MKIKSVIGLLILSLFFYSCEYFETKKISSETFVKDEIKSINWKDVDQYPIFKNCELIKFNICSYDGKSGPLTL